MAYRGGEDQDASEATTASRICPGCFRGKGPGTPTCAKCKNAHVQDKKTEARAQVNEAKYKAFVEAESLSIMKRSDLGEQITRSNAIAAKKQKCMEAVPAIMQALPAVLATGGHITNPFAVSKAQKDEARHRQAEQEAGLQAVQQQQQQQAAAQQQLQQQAAAQQQQLQQQQLQQQQAAQQQQLQQQQAAQQQQAVQAVQAVERERQVLQQQVREFAAQVQLEKDKMAREHADLDRKRANLARQATPGSHVNTLQHLTEEDRRARANVAADAASNREVDEMVNSIMRN